jgi:hypothetical protein
MSVADWKVVGTPLRRIALPRRQPPQLGMQLRPSVDDGDHVFEVVVIEVARTSVARFEADGSVDAKDPEQSRTQRSLPSTTTKTQSTSSASDAYRGGCGQRRSASGGG